MATRARVSRTWAGDSHRSGRTAHAMVYAGYNGKPTVFDVAKVTLAIRYAVLK